MFSDDPQAVLRGTDTYSIRAAVTLGPSTYQVVRVGRGFCILPGKLGSNSRPID